MALLNFKQYLQEQQKRKSCEEETANEELTDKQKKLDKNKNGKLDSQDFKKLRGE